MASNTATWASAVVADAYEDPSHEQHGTVNISGGTFSCSSTNSESYCALSLSSGSIKGSMTISGGKFRSNDGVITHSSNGDLTVTGGYFNEKATGTSFRNQVASRVSAPYAVLDLSVGDPLYAEGYRYKVAEAYNLTWTTDGDALTGGYTSGLVEPGAAITAPATPTKTGYTFAGWTPAFTGTMPAANTEYTATWTPNTNTAYTVKHYKQNLAGDGYDLADTDNLTGTTATSVTPAVKSYEGFTAPSTQTVTILADGSRVVTYNYTRNSYTLAWALDGGSISVAGTTAGSVKYGAPLTAPTVTKTGYTFTGWTPAVAATMPAANTTYTATWTPNTNTAYTVKHYKQNLAGDGYDLADTDNLTGTTATSVTPAVKSYTGFTAPGTQTKTIAADGSMVIEYKYTRNSYTLTWNLDGGSISVAGTPAGSVKYGTALVAPTVVKTGYTFAAWSPAVAATMPAANTTYTATWTPSDIGFYADIVDVDNTNNKLIVNVTSWAASGWPYTINGVEYAKNAREADRTLKIPYVGTPGDNYAIMVKKTGGDVISHHTYVIPQEIKSNTTISANQTKNLYVKNGVNLTVNANITARNIYVAPEATLTINSDKTLTADSIFLRTTADHAAEMVLSGNLAGTTQLVYTRIIKDKDFHLFGIPLSCPVASVQLSDGFVPTYITGWVLRYYNEKRRSNEGADDNNWATLASGGSIAGGAGYELFSGSNYYREFYFPVDHTELTNEVAVVYDLGAAGEKHAGWNAITSPFTSTYTNVKVPEGLAVSWYMGGYYSQEIPTTIPAATVFAFQATKTGTISFEGESIVAALPRRAATEEAVRIQWLDLDIADQNGVGDQTSIYSHPTRYDAVFQKGIDIAKQSFEAPRAIIYSSHAYGEMAFAGVADSLLEQGVALTVYSPTAQPLTISMRDNDWLNRMKYVWLIDHQTGERTDLLWENYTYEASEGTTRGRFTIQGVFRTPTITTDIENGMMNDESMQVEKFILNDKIYIRVNGHLYDATGKLVNRK